MSYSATLDLKHAPSLSRLWALLTMLFVRFVLLIPHFIVLFFLEILAVFCIIIGPFGVLFTGQYPRWAEHVVVGYYRWVWRLVVYAFCLTDEYPPFSFESTGYAATQDIAHEEKNSRIWALLTILFPLKVLALFPHLVILVFSSFVAAFVLMIGPFAVLFIGHYPRPLENFLVGYQRWYWRVTAFALSLTKQYPPFSF